MPTKPAAKKSRAIKPVATNPAAKAKPAQKLVTGPAPAAKSAPAAKPVAAATATPAKPAAADAKVVRDGFTMPQVDYDLLKSLKAQCLKAGIEVKKSELLRAGVQVLAALPMATLAERLRALPPVKAGRRKSKV